MFHSEFGHILQDITFLSSLFTSVSFRRVKKQSNCMTHRLARRAIFSHFIVWMESVPSDTFNVHNFNLRLIA